MRNPLKSIFRRYPVSVIVFEKRGNNAVQLIKDKATRIEMKEGGEAYYLKKKNALIAAPTYKFLYTDKKGKPVLMLYQPTANRFLPIQFNNPSQLDVALTDQEVDLWSILQIRKTHDIYPKERSWLEKYASFLILGFTATIMLLIVIFSMNALASVAGAVSGISAQLSEVASMLTGWTPGGVPGT